MNITFDKYIENPSGSTMVWTFKDMYKKLYMEKYGKTILRESGKMKFDIYYDKKKTEFYIHLKVPSEVVEKFYYDVVIKFYTDNQAIKNSLNLRKFYVKFFSNDPRFVYTFAYSFLKNDFFVRECLPRMSKKAVKKAAIEKNPKNEIGYVKSLYFAYLYMKDNSLFNGSTYIRYGKPYSQKELIKDIMDSEKKVELREEAEKEIQKKKRLEKQKSKRQTKEKERRETLLNHTNQFNKGKTINTKKTKTVNFSKVSNKSKKI